MIKSKNKKKIPTSLTSDFANLASHQLRTPLSGMKWILELLQRPSTGSLNKKQKEYLDKIVFFNDRLIALVNDLLEVSKAEQDGTQLHLQPTDITQIIRGLLKEKENEIKRKNFHVTFTVEQEPFPVVRTEPSKIKHALNNLLTNAFLYTPEDGRITIELTFANNNPSMLQCAIKDTGMGIPKEEQKRIFDKFFRGSNVSRVESVGTGLGLYIAKAFIVASGGKIWFESKTGKGSDFYFTLPIVKK
ncbi:MAG: HAMP domain-containing histidine kinase [Candidatus Doudnabacteria bacterium]|nr:HAMP domain-containing histidine kinase [Candidatus Doudnabacteria bacterium]